jgi:pimeloyl-ACP methyl ester carboxylesterase
MNHVGDSVKRGRPPPAAGATLSGVPASNPAPTAPDRPRRRWPLRLGAALLLLVAVALTAPLLLPLRATAGILPPRELAGVEATFVSVNGLDVHVVQRGRGEPAVLLLHGFGASTFSWREVIDTLGRKRGAVAFDRPAFGFTERPMPESWSGENPYTPAAAAELTIGLMDALRIDRAVLVGHSAGAAVAILAAADHPGRVAGLVLEAPALGAPSAVPVPGWLLRSPQLRRIGPRLVRGIAGRGDAVIRQAWHDPWRVGPAVIEGYRKPLKARDWDRALWEYTAAGQGTDAAERLKGLDLPVLVVTGDDDRIVPPAASRAVAALRPGIELVELKDTGHIPHEERPAEFLAAIAPFLDRVAPAAVN